MIAVEAGEAVTVEHGVPKGELYFGPPATWPTRLVKGLGIFPDMSAVGAKRPLPFMYSDKACFIPDRWTISAGEPAVMPTAAQQIFWPD